MNKSVLTASCAAAWLARAVLAAHAGEQIPWGTVGNWEIAIDTTAGNGCYAVATWDGGTVLRIGWNPDDSAHYLLLGNDDWPTFDAEEEYDLRFRFDDLEPWQVPAQGFRFAQGGTVYLHAKIADLAFVEQFMRQSRMRVSRQGGELDTLRLTGSLNALNEVKTCQETVDATGLPGETEPAAD